MTDSLKRSAAIQLTSAGFSVRETSRLLSTPKSTIGRWTQGANLEETAPVGQIRDGQVMLSPAACLMLLRVMANTDGPQQSRGQEALKVFAQALEDGVSLQEAIERVGSFVRAWTLNRKAQTAK